MRARRLRRNRGLLAQLERRVDHLRYVVGPADLERRRQYHERTYQEMRPAANGDSVRVGWSALDDLERQKVMRRWWEPEPIRMKGEALQDYRRQVAALIEGRWNQLDRRTRALNLASLVSPLSALRTVTWEIARTGPIQYQKMERALFEYRSYFLDFIWERRTSYPDGPPLSELSPFEYTDSDSLSDVLIRNVAPLVLLGCLSLLGFAGAFVAFLRYDVR